KGGLSNCVAASFGGGRCTERVEFSGPASGTDTYYLVVDRKTRVPKGKAPRGGRWQLDIQFKSAACQRGVAAQCKG
ncbi:MAG: hypothetical protein ABEL76_00620, partial [Bradymonadaceae bacterium]